MLEDLIVIGIVMALVEIAKVLLKDAIPEALMKQILPLVVLGLAGAVNVANAAIFAPDTSLLDALRQGIIMGATAGGIYSLGKAFLGKS